MCLNERRVNYIVRKDGKKILQWRKDFNEIQPFVIVSCGKCVECQIAQANTWVLRCQAELKQHSQACFMTLTYRENPIYLVKKDFQDFIKRLRFHLAKYYDIQVRYFGCGEYGKKKGRPHYHLILFGFCPNDLRYLYTENGFRIYTSKFIEDIWSHGFITVGVDMSERALRYQCKYLQKQNSKIDPLTGEIHKPFLLMSRRPGIGACLVNYSEFDFATGKVYLQGKTVPIPRYYLNRLERQGVDVSPLRIKRSAFLSAKPCSVEELRAKIAKYQNFFGKSIDNSLLGDYNI